MAKNDFILIIGRIPDKQNEQDGMIQRELAIDNLLSAYNRVYVENIIPELFYLKFPRKHIQNFLYCCNNKLKCLKNKKVKLFKFTTKKNIYTLCENAKKIYIHSLYSLNNINDRNFLEKFKDKIIIDIHGCVVEELEFYNQEKSIIQNMQNLESEYFTSVNTLIAVSNSMIKFYKNKYPQIKTNFIILPIFNLFDYKKNTNNNKLKIIYSGGTAKWQNIDLMTNVIKKLYTQYDITILTPDIETFKQKLGDNDDRIEIKTVPSNELYKEYQTADLGFILRDDINVNKVACPTKLIEYLQFGIIPIVKHPAIGDFAELNYSYIPLEQLIAGQLPAKTELLKMRENNYNVIDKLNKQHDMGVNALFKIIEK